MVGLEIKMDAPASENDVEKCLVKVISCVLEQLVARNDKLPFNPVNATIFHATRPPTVSIKSYLERVLKYTNVSSGCLIASLIFIDRFVQQQPSFVINSLNIHRLLITSVMISMKFLDDLYYNNSYYAKVGGVPCAEMNSLELQFLFRLNFHLHVRQEEYERYYNELSLHVQRATSCSCVCIVGPLEAATMTSTDPCLMVHDVCIAQPAPPVKQPAIVTLPVHVKQPAMMSVMPLVAKQPVMVAVSHIPWHGA